MTVSTTYISGPEQLSQVTEQTRRKMADSTRLNILVSMGTCGIAAGTTPVLEALEKTLADTKPPGITITKVGCMGLCHSEPSIEVVDTGTGKSVIYGNVTPTQAEAIVGAGTDVAEGLNVIDRGWFYPEDEENTQRVPQARIVLRNSGRINPEKILEYIANSGYQALGKVLTRMSPGEVVAEITDSGLRGRGGAGFPTHVKVNAKVDTVLVNGASCEPLLMSDPYLLEQEIDTVIKGLKAVLDATGATEGIISAFELTGQHVDLCPDPRGIEFRVVESWPFCERRIHP